jgi:hypothetical protein
MLLALISVALLPRHSTHKPAWFDEMLAGYALAYDQKHSQVAVYDPGTGFMLIREPECDGGDMTLLLTRDRYEVDKMGYKVPHFAAGTTVDDGSRKLVEKALPSLATGKGVKIGDSPQRMMRLLKGHPHRERSGNRDQFVSYKYSFKESPGELSKSYDETYTFKSGKLIEVMFGWGPGDEREDNAVIQHAAKKVQADRMRSHG